jgi:hypothetical protein
VHKEDHGPRGDCAGQCSAFEVLPGLHVNGERTALENLADLGGVRALP